MKGQTVCFQLGEEGKKSDSLWWVFSLATAMSDEIR